MANHIAEVAKMLGVELGEIFKIQIDENKTFQFRFTESGFQCFNGKMWDEDVVAMACLNLLLVGKYAIKRKPWKPKENDYYYSVEPDGSIDNEYWGNDSIDMNYYKLGNCYRTRKEAEANRDKWVAFYASDEVLEV